MPIFKAQTFSIGRWDDCNYTDTSSTDMVTHTHVANVSKGEVKQNRRKRPLAFDRCQVWVAGCKKKRELKSASSCSILQSLLWRPLLTPFRKVADKKAEQKHFRHRKERERRISSKSVGRIDKKTLVRKKEKKKPCNRALEWSRRTKKCTLKYKIEMKPVFEWSRWTKIKSNSSESAMKAKKLDRKWR